VQRCGESAFGRDQRGELVEPLREGDPRLVPGGQRRGRVGAGVDLAFDHGLDQVRALREVPVERAELRRQPDR
jgi:hypothetical protein